MVKVKNYYLQTANIKHLILLIELLLQNDRLVNNMLTTRQSKISPNRDNLKIF